MRYRRSKTLGATFFLRLGFVPQPNLLNLQPKGGKSKPYQVKQVRNLILKYKLGEQRDE